MKRITVVLVAFTLFTLGCKKKEISLDNIKTPLLDPSFALPIGYAKLNIGDIEREYDVNNFLYNNCLLYTSPSPRDA